MAVADAEFKAGMRQLAAAVNIITTQCDEGRFGMTASAVMSLTAEPPQLGIAVNKSNASWKAIKESGFFAVNVLANNHAELASIFAGAGRLPPKERFAMARWETLETGAPVLVGSAAGFDCRVVSETEFSSHTLFVGLVEGVRTTENETPLLYMDGTWASLVRAEETHLEAYERIVDQVAESLSSTGARDGDAGSKLACFARDFIDLNVAQLDVLSDFFSKERFAPTERLEKINARKREVEKNVHAVLAEGIESGEFKVRDAGLATHAVLGLLNSVHRWPIYPDKDALAENFSDLVLSMVGAGAAKD